jgi:L-lactate dehydrogenase complex protein LldG
VTGGPDAGSGLAGRPSEAARDEVLRRIGVALRTGGADARQPAAAAAPAPAPGANGPATAGAAGHRVPDAAEGGPAYRVHGTKPGTELLDLLAGRLVDNRAQVRRVAEAALEAAVADALGGRGARRNVVPPRLRLKLPASVEVTVDDQLTAAELDGFDGVVTRAAVAIAETGTIVLDGSPGQGRRAISLVPDYHLCIVAASQVVQLVPEAVARLATAAERPLTWISGPSATSDIELERVEGVHGPRTLEVILTQD